MFDLKLSILEEYAPFFVSGTILTIKLSVAAIIVGFFLGLFLALARLSSRKWLSLPAVCFIESIRGTPLLLQILVAYFGIIPLLMRNRMGIAPCWLFLSMREPI